MTKIDFHSHIEDKLNYICRLVRKARSTNCDILIFDKNIDNLKTIDDALWTFSATDFLPHVYASDTLVEKTPIILCSDESQQLHRKDILLNLHLEVPSFFQEFNRVIEIISTDENDVKKGRLKYRHYQQLGHVPTHLNTKHHEQTN